MAVEQLSVGDVVIEEVDLRSLSEDDIVALNTFNNVLQAESDPEDPPIPLEMTRANVRNIPEVVALRTFWGREPDGGIAATAQTSYLRTEENPHALEVGISVRSDRRRRGIAKTLLYLVTDVAEVEGRTLLVGGTSDRVAAGEAFARKVGAEPGLANTQNRLILADVDRTLVRRWVEEGPERAPDYSLVAIDGAYPEELLEAITDVHNVMNTAPRDDLEMEDTYLTSEHIREFERSMLASGTERWSLFARHDPTGELVGYTEVYWNPKRPHTVGQGDTAVHPEHRGHALGKWLKAAMLERVLAERVPQGAVDIRTGNADSNDAMLGINYALGFKPHRASTVWQVRLDTVRAYLSEGGSRV